MTDATARLRVLLRLAKWIMTGISAICVVNLVLAPFDITAHLGWGYDWRAVLASLGMMILALTIRHAAKVGLRHLT